MSRPNLTRQIVCTPLSSHDDSHVFFFRSHRSWWIGCLTQKTGIRGMFRQKKLTGPWDLYMGEKNTPNLKGLFWVKTGRFSRFTKFYLIFFGSPQSTTELFAIFFYPASRQYKTHTPPRELLSFQNLWSIFLLLMEEILHHLACIKPYKEWATSTTVPSTGERRISEPSTVSHPNLPRKQKEKKSLGHLQQEPC